ncbi:rod shape-determining protein MreC [Aquabacterium fontiphilum]|jgi:rod shape-determining protein MreC|uniref:rod shape-determining protein MreC n=1 Tax=Aquabacterium fontiphilum TaxID=450365 RepID=UPI0013790DC4|nr:rod shape-determining protein MreC [Aquabacterium fontiphilum]NBD19356.1 rod shape-determining protein MreC [Aquabacterium fontiphilum]
MPLATLDRSPPPFFKQGPSAFTRLTFYAALAVFLMVADARWAITQPLRAVLATLLHPVQQGLLAPARGYDTLSHYVRGLEEAKAVQQRAERALMAQADRVMRLEQLQHENERLRALLDLRPRASVPTLAAEVQYDAPDPFSRKVVIDRGGSHGVRPGAPVIDEHGVLGQVTRVYPLSSEVTLVTDKDAAVPVINLRTQQRGVAFGQPKHRGMELRFMAGNADVQAGDVLQTSGLDGVYPPGLPVAQVTQVDRRADSAFARIVLKPYAHAEQPRHVLLLLTVEGAPNPVSAASAASAAAPASGVAPAASTPSEVRP